MSDNEQKRGRGRPRKEDQQIKETEDLESIFSDMEQTYTVKVYRTEPEWCAGYLGQFHIAVGRVLTPEEVRNRFGGRVFDLRVYSGSGPGIKKRHMLVIDDVPRRDGREILRDGSLAGTASRPTESKDDIGIFESIKNLNLPPHLQRQALLYQLGMLDEEPERNPNKGISQDLMLQQMMMDMMNQSRQAQMQMTQQQFDMHKNMMQARQDLENSAKPKDPMGDVNHVIKLVREINGIKSELGGAETDSLAGRVLENTMPLVESFLSEFMSFKKLQAQTELQRVKTTQQNKPELPSRQRAAAPELPAPNKANTQNDPKSMALEMARMYAGLSPEEQSEVMQAFMGGLDDVEQSQQNIVQESSPVIIDDVGDDFLSEDDRRILNGDDQDQTGDIQNSEYAGTAQTDNQTDRPGDTSGIDFSTD